MVFSLRIPLWILVLILGALDCAVAGPALSKRDVCGAWDKIPAGPYTVFHNNWGAASATSGWQCTGLDYQGGNSISWHTTWDWQGGLGSVKSYSNADISWSARQLSSISSIPSSWDWT